MAQLIDMRRLHMGCGESLQAHLPLALFGQRRRQATPRVMLEHPQGTAGGDKKQPPVEKH
jgi:hypothetical protein